LLENKLEMRKMASSENPDSTTEDAVTDEERVNRLEERAQAAERRVSVAREAMTRYVSESQKCSPCPTVYQAAADELTPVKRAVEKWMEVSEAKDEERRLSEKHANHSNSDDEEGDDDYFDSPLERRRGNLPTPRLRARIAIRRTLGPVHSKLHIDTSRGRSFASDHSDNEEFRRRAKAIGMSLSPFARDR
jgi:hypothetical protein